jgi:1,4-dihydroxy-2-naphthoate octaprenyltransferase
MPDSRAGGPLRSPVVHPSRVDPIPLARAWISALGLPMTMVVLLQAGYALTIAGHLGALSPGRVLLTLALLIPESIGRRLINDSDDFRREVDRADNARPGSALALGLSMKQVRMVGLGCFTVAVVGFAYLLYTTSPLSLVVIPLAFVTLIYSGGPSPLGYRGFGEVVDFVFTGFLVTGAVIWVNVNRITPAVVFGALAAGFLFATIMFHNNLADRTEDLKAGKHTVAHVLSTRAAKVWYVTLIGASYLCVLAVAHQLDSIRYAAPLLTLPYAIYITQSVLRSKLDKTMPSWFHMPRLLAAFFAVFIVAGWL